MYVTLESDPPYGLLTFVPLQATILVKTKLMHAEKVENGDELVSVENVAIENMTVEKLMEVLAKPNRDIESYSVLLSFKKRNGVVYRFLGETMKVSLDQVPLHLLKNHDIAGDDHVNKAPPVENSLGPSNGASMLTGSA